MRKRPIRKAGVTEEKEGVLIDPERDCTRKRKYQGALSLFKIDTGDRAWVLTSSVEVLAMTMPGLRVSTADWSGARISWARSCKASLCSAKPG